MSVLIIKLGATGDVVRTTPLLRRLDGSVSWVTAGNNLALLQGIDREVRCVSWENRNRVADTAYDLVINLEDDRGDQPVFEGIEIRATLRRSPKWRRPADLYFRFAQWFDLSLLSTYGREEADRLKLLNRRTYQELVFDGLGFGFYGETYYLSPPCPTGLKEMSLSHRPPVQCGQ